MSLLARAHMVSFLCYLCLLPELFLGRYSKFLALALLTSCVCHCAFAFPCSQFHTLPPPPLPGLPTVVLMLPHVTWPPRSPFEVYVEVLITLSFFIVPACKGGIRRQMPSCAAA